jgi:hypothetical protein
MNRAVVVFKWFLIAQECGIMDLQPTIRTLQLELERVEMAIAQLEKLQDANGDGSGKPNDKSKRGRKSMGSEERQEVSLRMKRYWASRRETGDQNPSS